MARNFSMYVLRWRVERVILTAQLCNVSIIEVKCVTTRKSRNRLLPIVFEITNEKSGEHHIINKNRL